MLFCFQKGAISRPVSAGQNECKKMFQDRCSGMFHAPGFIDVRQKIVALRSSIATF